MKKLILFTALLFVSVIPVTILAQETTLPAPVTEENTQPELPIGEEQTTNTQTPAINEETQQTFINGLIAGAIAGLIVGGVITWFLKDKII